MITINNILETIDYIEYRGKAGEKINNIISLDNVENGTNDLSWCGDAYSDKLKNIKSSSIIIVS